MNNWEIKGYKSRDEGIVQVLGFLKSQEEKIMSRSISDEAIITCGEMVLNLSYKPKKKKK